MNIHNAILKAKESMTPVTSPAQTFLDPPGGPFTKSLEDFNKNPLMTVSGFFYEFSTDAKTTVTIESRKKKKMNGNIIICQDCNGYKPDANNARASVDWIVNSDRPYCKCYDSFVISWRALEERKLELRDTMVTFTIVG